MFVEDLHLLICEPTDPAFLLPFFWWWLLPFLSLGFGTFPVVFKLNN